MLDRRPPLPITFAITCLMAGCGVRDPQLFELPIYILGAIVWTTVDANKHYDKDYNVAIRVDDSKCKVTELELKYISDNIHAVTPGMKRADIERLIGIDKIRNRIVVTGMGSDLARFRNIYYLGNKIGIEMEFNEFTSVLNETPKLIGSYWVSVR